MRAETLTMPSKRPASLLPQFSLSELLLWVTYAAIATALYRVDLRFAILFVAWIVPSVSRFRAMGQIMRDHPDYYTFPFNPLINGATLLHSVIAEMGLSIVSAVVTIMIWFPIAMVVASAILSTRSAVVETMLPLVLFSGILGTYIYCHLKLRQWTWPRPLEE